MARDLFALYAVPCGVFTRFLRVVFVHGGTVFGLTFLFLVHAFALHPGIAGHVACRLLSTSEKLV